MIFARISTSVSLCLNYQSAWNDIIMFLNKICMPLNPILITTAVHGLNIIWITKRGTRVNRFISNYWFLFKSSVLNVYKPVDVSAWCQC